MESDTFLQELAGTLLFLGLVVWAAFKLMHTPFPTDEDEDDDIHLGI